jgi:hypothetical protein
LEQGSDTVEYPPLAISMMELPIRVLGLDSKQTEISRLQTTRYITAAHLGFAVADGIGFALLFYVLRFSLNAPPIRILSALCSYTLCGLSLYAVLYDRMDIVMGTFMLGALAALLSPLPFIVSFVLLATAVNFKIVAVLLAPVWIIGSLPCHVFSTSRMHQVGAIAGRLLIFLIIVLVMFASYFVHDGMRSLEFLAYHAERGIQFESLSANVVLLFYCAGLPVSIEHSFGSTNIEALGVRWIAFVGTLLTISMECLMYWQLWRMCQRKLAVSVSATTIRHAYPQMMIRFSVLALAIGVCGSKVFSVQYMLWFVALTPLVILNNRDDDHTLQILFLFICILTMFIYPVLFDSQIRPRVWFENSTYGFLPPTPLGVTLLSTRNALFAWVTVLVGRAACNKEKIRND